MINRDADRIAECRGMTVTLDDDLVAAINEYLDTEWKDGRDPSGFGALNVVGYIGERVAGIVYHRNALAKKKTP